MMDSLKQEILRKPMYCSIMFDGSSDKTLFEKEVVAVKLVENGEPKIKLLGWAQII